MHPVTAIVNRIVSILGVGSPTAHVYKERSETLNDADNELPAYVVKQGAVEVVRDLCTFDQLAMQMQFTVGIVDQHRDEQILADICNAHWLTVHKLLIQRGALGLEYVLDVVPFGASTPQRDVSTASKVQLLEVRFAVAFFCGRDDPSVPDVN